MKKFLFISLILFFALSCSNKKSSYNDESVYKEYTEQQTPYGDNDASYKDDNLENEKNSALDETKSEVATGDVTAPSTETSLDSETSTNEDILDTSYLNTDLSIRKIIKTANLKFEVKNVEKTTDLIEDLAREFGGYTSQSKLTSYLSNTEIIELSRDSVLKVSEFSVYNNMIIIVPKENFDQVLKELSKVYIYLDSRDITTEDVSALFLRNKLKAINKLTYEQRMLNAIDDKGKKLNDIIAAEQKAANLGDKAIDDKIANFTLQDKIDYSRITINMYQASSVFQNNIENTDLSDYKPSFWVRSGKALASGWSMILNLFVGLMYLWPVILLGLVVFFVVRFFMKKYNTKKE